MDVVAFGWNPGGGTLAAATEKERRGLPEDAPLLGADHLRPKFHN